MQEERNSLDLVAPYALQMAFGMVIPSWIWANAIPSWRVVPCLIWGCFLGLMVGAAYGFWAAGRYQKDESKFEDLFAASRLLALVLTGIVGFLGAVAWIIRLVFRL